MATKLTGMLNLSKIPKELIRKNKNGESIIWIDLLANPKGADQYGNTHTVTTYDKEQRKAIYLANLKPQELQARGAQPAPENEAPNSDLPF